MLTATGTAVVTAALAFNAFAMTEPQLSHAAIAAGLKRAQCSIPAKQAKVVGHEWLGRGLQIVEVSCSAAGSILFAVPTDPRARANLIKLEDWRNGQLVTGYRVASPDYDRDSRTMSATETKSGASDCGTIKEWKWTGWSFQLIHVWNKDTCDGEQFEWETRERWQVFPKPAERPAQAPTGFIDPSLSKCPPRCNHQSSTRPGRPASAQMAKNQTQPVAAATKPAPDDR